MEEAPTVNLVKIPASQPFITYYLLDNINYEIKVSIDKINLLIEVKNKSEIENSIYLFDN